MTFEPDESVSIVGTPIFRVVGDEVFILMPDSKVHWLRNATARAVWERLVASGAEGVTPALLAGLIAQEFEVTPDRALVDVLVFVGELGGRGLVTRPIAFIAHNSAD